MTLYFSWSIEREAFDPHRHQKEDEKIFYFSLKQKENEGARAFILVKNTLLDLARFKEKKYALISTKLKTGESVCLFQGYLSSPIHLEGNCVALEFISEAEDREKKLEDLIDENKDFLAWDPLFISDPHKKLPKETLMTKPLVFYWDRVQGNPALSNLFEGKNFLDLGKDFYASSLNIEKGAQPLLAVEVTLEAQWIQKVRSYTNLGKKIAQNFPEKIINTFTGENLRKKWPKMGQKIKGSGYFVAVSQLEEIDPPQTGALNLYPQHSSKLWAQNEEGVPYQAYIKRYWFKGRLVLGWLYKQKRVEKLTFTLKHHFHDLFKESAKPLEKIHLCLGEISPRLSIPFWYPNKFYDEGVKIQEDGKIYACLKSHTSCENFRKDCACWRFEKDLPTALGPESRASFFVTDRGYQAFENALEIAKTHLAFSARALQISFSGSFERLCGITLDHTVQIQDDRLPGGTLKGKVISYEIIADGKTGERRVDVRLAVSIGTEVSLTLKQEEGAPSPVNYAKDYAEDSYTPSWHLKRSKGGIMYARYDTQTPPDKFSTLYRLGGHHMIKELSIKNKAQEQEVYLKENQYPKGEIGRNSLKARLTTVCLNLKELNTKDALHHQIGVQLHTSWSAPRQIY